MKWLILLALMSCTRTIYTPIVSSRTIVDTVVSQVADSALIRALFECDSAGNVLMRELEQSKGRTATQAFTYADNELRVETRWLTKNIERRVEIRDTVTVVEQYDVVRDEPYVPGYVWWLMVLVGFGGAWIGWRLG